MLLTIQHSLTMTTPDNPAYENKPSDWNKSHLATISLQPTDLVQWFSAGTQSISSGTLVFANSNSVTFGMNGGTITASIPAGGGGIAIADSAGTQTSGTVQFANSNGVSFGLNAGTMTATVKTDYQSSGAYLTTAALSQDSSKYAGTGTSATNASITLNTAGLAISISAAPAATSLSFVNSNGVSFGIAGSTLTATVQTNYQSSGAYLTTAALSQDSSKYAGTSTGITGRASITLNTAGIAFNGSALAGTSTGMTGGTVTLNSSGIAISLPAYLTTAALSQDSSKYAGTSTGMTGGSVTLNTSGIAISLPAYLTTAALSQDSSKYAGTSTGMTGGSVTLNTSGIAISLPAYLTTARASTDAIGLNTAQTNVTWTVNSSGLSFNAGGYAGTGTSATNASITLNTNGLAISVAAPAAATISSFENFAVGSFIGQTLNGASRSQAVAFMLPQAGSFSFLRIPAAMTTTQNATAVTNATFTSYNAEMYHTWNAVVYSVGTGTNSTQLMSAASGSVGWTQRISVSFSTANSAASYTQALSFAANGGQVTASTQYSQTSASLAAISTNWATQYTGNRMIDINFANSLSAGPYWLVFGYSSTTSTSGQNFALIANNNTNYSAHNGVLMVNAVYGQLGNANLTSALMGAGSFSTAGGGTTNSLPLSAISSSASQLKPYFQMLRSA